MAVSEDGGAQRIRDCSRWAGVDVGYARMTGRASMFICSMADSQKRNWLAVSGVAEKRRLEDDAGAHRYCGSGLRTEHQRGVGKIRRGLRTEGRRET